MHAYLVIALGTFTGVFLGLAAFVGAAWLWFG